LPDGTAAPDGDRLAALDVAEFGGHVSRWKNVGEEQHLLIRQFVRDLDRTDIGERHAKIFRLST
jgi:hypothetical protein